MIENFTVGTFIVLKKTGDKYNYDNENFILVVTGVSDEYYILKNLKGNEVNGIDTSITAINNNYEKHVDTKNYTNAGAKRSNRKRKTRRSSKKSKKSRKNRLQRK